MKNSSLALISLCLLSACGKESKTKEVFVEDPSQAQRITSLEQADLINKEIIEIKDQEISDLNSKYGDEIDELNAKKAKEVRELSAKLAEENKYYVAASISTTLSEALRGLPGGEGIRVKLEQAIRTALNSKLSKLELQKRIVEEIKAATAGSTLADAVNKAIEKELKDRDDTTFDQAELIEAVKVALEGKGDPELIRVLTTAVSKAKDDQGKLTEQAIAKAIEDSSANGAVEAAVAGRIAKAISEIPAPAGPDISKIMEAVNEALAGQGNEVLRKKINDAVNAARDEIIAGEIAKAEKTFILDRKISAAENFKSLVDPRKGAEGHRYTVLVSKEKPCELKFVDQDATTKTTFTLNLDRNYFPIVNTNTAVPGSVAVTLQNYMGFEEIKFVKETPQGPGSGQTQGITLNLVEAAALTHADAVATAFSIFAFECSF